MFCVCFTHGDQKPDSENAKHINPGSQHAKHFYRITARNMQSIFSPAGNMQSIPIPPRNMGSISILNLNIHGTISTPVRNIQAFSPQPVTYQAFPSKHGNAYPPLVRNMQNMCINLQIFLRFSRIKVYDHSFQRMQKQDQSIKQICKHPYVVSGLSIPCLLPQGVYVCINPVFHFVSFVPVSSMLPITKFLFSLLSQLVENLCQYKFKNFHLVVLSTYIRQQNKVFE